MADREINAPGAPRSPQPLTAYGRNSILAAAFLAWMFGGVALGLFPLAARPATIGLLYPTPSSASSAGRPGALTKEQEAVVGNWFARYTCAFLIGAGVGGFLFGWLGDRFGRKKALAWSVLCFTLFTAPSAWARSPEELLVLRFLACLGVGGVWPNGIALASEAWSEVSRPTLAGLFGTAANVGIVGIAIWGIWFSVNKDNWHEVMLVCAAPFPLGLLIWFAVPESPRWLASRTSAVSQGAGPTRMWDVFKPPHLQLTLLGIVLGTIPLFGNWSGGNWLVPWSDAVAEQAAARSDATEESPAQRARANQSRKAWTQFARSSGASIGSLIGGWLASLLGRRLVYFLISVGSWGVSAYIFRFLTPLDPQFLSWTFLLGFVTTIYFGWLPLFLPELFPTEIRSTGSGVTFNFGRIITAAGVLGAGMLLKAFDSDYAKVLAVTSSVYLAGMFVIWFAPDTSKKRLGVE